MAGTNVVTRNVVTTIRVTRDGEGSTVSTRDTGGTVLKSVANGIPGPPGPPGQRGADGAASIPPLITGGFF